ncbi:MAG: peptidoglycan DD-metalloendopeptidase family protein [Aureispira sp.]|nr:peptidoglycan DD-metalloendopeptidase family protein [Aureispira sp.]
MFLKPKNLLKKNRWWTQFSWLVLIIFALLGNSLGLEAQSRKSLEKKRKSVNRQIKKATSQLKKTVKTKKATISSLTKLQKKIASRASFIETMDKELQEVNVRIDRKMTVIETLEDNIEQLKQNYTKIVRHLYRYQLQNNGLFFVLSADSFNKAYRRWVYLQQLEKHRKTQVKLILATQESLTQYINSLEAQKLDKSNLLTNELQQKLILDQEIEEKNKIVKKLKSKEKTLKKDLKRKASYKRQLNKKIERIIRSEIAASKSSARKYASTKRKGKNPSKGLPKMNHQDISTRFKNNKGRLPMPIKNGRIIGRYGKHVHPVFEQVTTVNNGIDIKGSKSTKVESIYDGVVVSVFTIPGFNNAVMVKHGEYYTTYSNLSKVYVKRGKIVKKGARLGLIHRDSGTGSYVLHFELWHGKNKQNPSHWIRSRGI